MGRHDDKDCYVYGLWAFGVDDWIHGIGIGIGMGWVLSGPDRISFRDCIAYASSFIRQSWNMKASSPDSDSEFRASTLSSTFTNIT